MGNCMKRPNRIPSSPVEPLAEPPVENTVNTNIYSFSGECIICMENPIQAAILDCGHLNFCVRCLHAMADNRDPTKDYLNYCPVCRAPFKGYTVFKPSFYYKLNYLY